MGDTGDRKSKHLHTWIDVTTVDGPHARQVCDGPGSPCGRERRISRERYARTGGGGAPTMPGPHDDDWEYFALGT
jgi:hypothetical protein